MTWKSQELNPAQAAAPNPLQPLSQIASPRNHRATLIPVLLRNELMAEHALRTRTLINVAAPCEEGAGTPDHSGLTRPADVADRGV
jgi:hypothetical protein